MMVRIDEVRVYSIAEGQAQLQARVPDDRELHAVCSLQTHRFGWELVLGVNGLLSLSQVCRSRDEVLVVCEQWRAVMVEGGWI